MVLKRLHVLNINHKHVAWLSSLDLKRSAEIVYFGQIHITDVVCRIVVLDLTSCPVDTFDLYSLAILDGPGKRNCSTALVICLDRACASMRTVWVPSVLHRESVAVV